MWGLTEIEIMGGIRDELKRIADVLEGVEPKRPAFKLKVESDGEVISGPTPGGFPVKEHDGP